MDEQAAALQAAFDASEFHRAINGRLTRSADGVTLEATLADTFSISLGRLHGGVVASLLDTAATWALIATTGAAWVTADLRVDFLKPVPSGRVVVQGTVVRSGRRIGRATASILVDGAPAATAIGSFLPIGSGS